MKRALGVLFCCGSLAAASTVLAQSDQCVGVEGAKPLNMVGHAGGSSQASFYYNAAGTLLESHDAEGYLVLDLGSHGPVRFPLDAEFKMSADKRTRLHGVKDLVLQDFQKGDLVQVKFSSYDGRVVRLKLKRPKK